MSKPIISNVRKTTVRAFSLGIICGGFITAGTIAAIPAKATPDSVLAGIAVTEEPPTKTTSLKAKPSPWQVTYRDSFSTWFDVANCATLKAAKTAAANFNGPVVS